MTPNNSKGSGEVKEAMPKPPAEKKTSLSEYFSRKWKTIRKYFSPAQLILYALLLAILIIIVMPKKHENKILPSVRVGWQPPWTNQGQIAVTLMSSNILENNGLKGFYTPFSFGGPMVDSVQNGGTFDVLFLGDQPAIKLMSLDPRWKIVACLPMYKSALLVRPKSKFMVVSDLRDRKIYTAIGSTTHREAVRMAKKAGLIKYDKKVSTAEVSILNEDQGHHLEILKRWTAQSNPFDSIDCLATYDPAVTFGVKKEFARVLESTITPGVILMREDYIKNSEREARNFLKSYLEAYFAFVENRERSDSIYNAISQSNLAISWYSEISDCDSNMHAKSIEDIDVGISPTLMNRLRENVELAHELGLIDTAFNMQNQVAEELLSSAREIVTQGWIHKMLNSVFFTTLSFVTPTRGVWDAILGGFILTMVILWVLHMIPKKAILGHPLMVACAPIFLARSKDLWRKHFVRMDIESTFAGLEVLQKMPNDVPYFAIATDVAIVRYLYKYGERSKFKALRPIVKVKGKIKILTDDSLVVPSSVGSANASAASGVPRVPSAAVPQTSQKFEPNNDTLILPGTVHEGFLLHLLKDDFSKVSAATAKSDGLLKKNSDTEDNSMLKMLNIVHREQIKQWLLWEPHYMPVIETNTFQEAKTDITEKYEWTLWLVANEVAWKKPELLGRVEGCLQEALQQCLNSSAEKIADVCYPYLFSDFTGLTKNHIKNILHDKDISYDWIVDPTKKWSTYKEDLRKFADKSGLSQQGGSKADERLCYYAGEYKLKILFAREVAKFLARSHTNYTVLNSVLWCKNSWFKKLHKTPRSEQL